MTTVSDQDWQSYDAIADRYDHVWADRFEPVGRALWHLMKPAGDASVLDIGTGTGALPLTLRQTTRHHGMAVGCDRSIPMLNRARARVTGLAVVATDALTLPFAADSFDVATASFVISHIVDHRRALDEARRVLKCAGVLGLSNWAPPSDPFSTAWSDAMAQAVSMEMLDRAIADVTPSEGHFSQAGRLEEALHAAGFDEIRGRTIELELSATVDEYLADRALSARGRLAHHLLGPEGWARCNASIDRLFRERFGSTFTYHRQVLIVAGRKREVR